MKRSEIIGEAKTWMGTKWQHQTALKGVACDCLGLVIGIARKFGQEVDAADLNYSQMPHHFEEKLYEKMKKYVIEIPVSEAKPGDILLFGFSPDWPAYHVGIVSYDGFIIHTWMDVGKVVETRLDSQWLANLRYAFRYQGVED